MSSASTDGYRKDFSAWLVAIDGELRLSKNGLHQAMVTTTLANFIDSMGQTALLSSSVSFIHFIS